MKKKYFEVYILYVLWELGFENEFNRFLLFGYDTGARHVTGNSTYSARTKHIVLRLIFSMELVRGGQVRPLYSDPKPGG